MSPPTRRIVPLLLALGCLAAPAVAQDSDPLAPARDALEANDPAHARELVAPYLHADDVRIAGRAHFFAAAADERLFDFVGALAEYQASVSIDPGGRYAARAGARIEYLRNHSEGGFAPLAALERVRTDPRRASDNASVDQLARALAGFPPGPVRAEARLLVGQAYAGRLHRPHDAAPVLHQLAADPTASHDMRQLALDLLAHVREETGELRNGVRELTELGAPAEVISRLSEQLRRYVALRVAIALASVTALALAWAIARALRAKRGAELARAWLRPLPLAHLAMLSLGGAFLAHEQDAHSMTPFFVFGGGALVVYLGATAWSLVGSDRTWLRVLRAATCASGMLAVSFLAMYRFDPEMLSGIGL